MFVSLPLILLALAMHPSASSSVAVPLTRRASRVPRTTLIDGRLYYKHSLLPVDVELYHKVDKSSRSEQAVLEEVLVPLLIKPLVNIIADYSKSRSREFAERLYQELWEGKMDLLGELYDVEKNVLKESHHFWDHFLGGAQPALGLVHMICETWTKHGKLKKTLDRFAERVVQKVPSAGYFVEQYVDGYPSLLENISVDERPQALLNDRAWSESIRIADYERIIELHYMLMQGNQRWLKSYIEQITWDSSDWLRVFRFLYLVEPAFLHRFFEIHFAKGSSDDRRLFNETAPIAIGVDPALSSALTATARENGWAEPVAMRAKMGTELADHKEAGGDVHMQPLQPVAQSLDHICCGAWYAASSTLKTIANGYTLQLHIAAANVLCALSTRDQCYLHIRNFENGKVSTHEFGAGYPFQVQVQHGDVIAISWIKECPSFLKATNDGTELSRGGCFECLKTFCYSAKASVYFVAIVEGDKLVGIEEETRFATALNAFGVKAEKMDKRKDGRKRKERGGGEEHTSKKSRKEKRKKKSEKGEERTSKKAKKEHGNAQSRRQRRGQRRNSRRDQNELQPS